MDRDIYNLVPEAILPLNQWMDACASRGLNIYVTGVRRQLIEQVAFYAQGRESYYEICKLREHAKLWKIGEAEAKKIITWTFLSRHIPEFCFPKGHLNYGKVLALDFSLKDQTGNLHWSGKVDANESGGPDYKEVGLLAEQYGFKWGGHFGDNPHIEWIFKGS